MKVNSKDFSLSVIVPNYNNARFLVECVNSILAQDYEELVEIIIVDDCSTDNSREVIGALCERSSLIVPVLLPENKQVSNARNTGLSQARGRYVTFIDADDVYFNKEKLKNEMELIKRFAMKGQHVVAYSSIVLMSNDGKTYKYPNAKFKDYLQGNIYKKLLLDVRSSLVMRDYCIKTDLLKSIGGYVVGNSLFEDFELILKISKKVPFYYTGEYGTAYRDSVTGLSKKPRKVLVRAKNEIIYNQLRTDPFLYRFGIRVQKIIIDFLKKIRRIVKRS
ncbi:MAG: glycosyltransferase family 2 protein [Clostridia bacterium]|nr:glycosyltransferase family 2 protein [Clostridia bacterium]